MQTSFYSNSILLTSKCSASKLCTQTGYVLLKLWSSFPEDWPIPKHSCCPELPSLDESVLYLGCVAMSNPSPVPSHREHHDWSAGISAQWLQAGTESCCTAGLAFCSEIRHCSHTDTPLSSACWSPCPLKDTLVSVVLLLLPSCYWGNRHSPDRSGAETRRGGQTVAYEAKCVSTGPLNVTHFRALYSDQHFVHIFLYKDLSGLFLNTQKNLQEVGDKKPHFRTTQPSKRQALMHLTLSCTVLSRCGEPQRKQILHKTSQVIILLYTKHSSFR